MIDGLKPYPDYRHSGDRWLQEVPSSWEKVRIKYLLREIDRRTQTGEEPLLSMRRDHGLVPLSQFSNKVAEPKALLAYKLVEPGELVVNRMQAGNGLVFVARIPGLISPDYAIFRPVRKVNLDYLEVLFRSYPMRATFRGESTGLGTGTAGFLRLYGDSFGAVEVALPTALEQQMIVRFLDRANRRIRRYMGIKRKLIVRLHEHRRALVHRTVTRGLEPEVRLKNSGVDWMGPIPEHWVIRKLRECGSIEGGMTPSMADQRFWGGAISWVTPKDMKRTAINDSALRITETAVTETGLRLIQPPALLMVVRGMILARRVPIARTTATVTINQDMKALKLVQGIDAQFLTYALDSAQEAFVPLIDEAGHGTRRLPTERWRELPVALPPQEEQIRIVTFLDAATDLLQATVARAENELTLLKDFRERLIADVVTGKLDVREAAATLPNETTPVEDVEDSPVGDEDEPAAEVGEAESEVTA